MSTPKEEHKKTIDGYFYACCPYCRNTLAQGKNDTEVFIKCPQCGRYIHIAIKGDAVLTKLKDKHTPCSHDLRFTSSYLRLIA